MKNASKDSSAWSNLWLFNYFLAIGFEFLFLASLIFLVVKDFSEETIAGFVYATFITYAILSIERSQLPLIGFGFPYILKMDLNLKGWTARICSGVLAIASTIILIYIINQSFFAWKPFMEAIPFGVLYASLLYFFTERGLRSNLLKI